jgi:hypothetical protein
LPGWRGGGARSLRSAIEDDQAETLLMRFRGRRFAGFGGIPPASHGAGLHRCCAAGVDRVLAHRARERWRTDRTNRTRHYFRATGCLDCCRTSLASTTRIVERLGAGGDAAPHQDFIEAHATRLGAAAGTAGTPSPSAARCRPPRRAAALLAAARGCGPPADFSLHCHVESLLAPGPAAAWDLPGGAAADRGGSAEALAAALRQALKSTPLLPGGRPPRRFADDALPRPAG